MRRITYVVHFPFPDAAMREEIYRRTIPPQTPLSDDIDWKFLAEKFQLSGGHIKNIILSAAFLAAQEHRELGMLAMEYRRKDRAQAHCSLAPGAAGSAQLASFLQGQLSANGLQKRQMAKLAVLADELLVLCSRYTQPDGRLMAECAVPEGEHLMIFRLKGSMGNKIFNSAFREGKTPDLQELGFLSIISSREVTDKMMPALTQKQEARLEAMDRTGEGQTDNDYNTAAVGMMGFHKNVKLKGECPVQKYAEKEKRRSKAALEKTTFSPLNFSAPNSALSSAFPGETPGGAGLDAQMQLKMSRQFSSQPAPAAEQDAAPQSLMSTDFPEDKDDGFLDMQQQLLTTLAVRRISALCQMNFIAPRVSLLIQRAQIIVFIDLQALHRYAESVLKHVLALAPVGLFDQA